MARLQKRKQAAVTTGSAKTSRPSLRDGFNAYTRSPWGPAWLPPSSAWRVSDTTDLASAPGGPDHTISRPQLSRSSACARHAASRYVHRIPASRVVTIARNAPPCEAGW